MKRKYPNFENFTPQQIVDNLETDRKNLRTIYAIYGGVYVAALAFYFLDTRFMILLFLVNILAGFLVVKPQEKEYKNNVIHANLLLGLAKDIMNIEHSSQGGFTRQQVDESGLVPQYKDSFISRECVTGTLSGMAIIISDITAPYQSTANGKQKVLWNSGCMISLELPKDTGLDIRYVDRDFFSFPDRVQYYTETNGLQAIDAQNEDFQQLFTVYSQNPQEIPKGLIKRLTAFREFTPGKIGLSIQGNKMTFLLNHRFLGAIQPTLKTPINQAVLSSNPLPEIKNVLDIAKFCSM